MKLLTLLTNHAKERLAERTKLSVEMFAQQFDNFETVSVGYRRAAGHWHRLFYSLPDEKYFVAIQDMRNGDVITVLPLEYHETLAWPISDKSKRRALLKVKPELIEVLPDRPSPIVRSVGTKAEITAISIDGARTNFGSHRFAATINTSEAALADDTFISKVLMKSASRGVPLASIDKLLLYDRHDSHLVTISWNDLEALAVDEARLVIEESGRTPSHGNFY